MVNIFPGDYTSGTADQDSHVQVAADGQGKLIDNSTLTREPTTLGGTGDVVYRQRVVLGSDDNPRQQVAVSGEPGYGELTVNAPQLDSVCEKLDEILQLLHLCLTR